jgi:hypothetical protein
LPLVIATSTDAVHALGQVGRAEIRRECAHQLPRHHPAARAARRAASASHRFALFAPGDRDAAHRLPPAPGTPPDTCSASNVADQRAQRAHVVAQQGVGRGEFEACRAAGWAIGVIVAG